MTCVQWNPSGPTSAPYPSYVLSQTQSSTGPTSPVQTGPTSWFLAQLSAANNTIPIPTSSSPVTGLNIWASKAGNADGQFNLTTGAYTAPSNGVYTITFQGSVIASTVGSNTITLSIYSNGLQQVAQISTNASVAAGDSFPVSISATLLLNKGATVQIFASGTASGWNWASQASPSAGFSTLCIKSEF